MRFRYCVLGFLIAGASWSGVNIAPANAQRFCGYSIGDTDFPLYAGQEVDNNLGRGKIVGRNPGSRVNVRQSPGGYHDGTYGLVDDIVSVLGYGLGPECKTWFKVQFPGSRYVGWIHQDYLRTLDYQGGLWD